MDPQAARGIGEAVAEAVTDPLDGILEDVLEGYWSTLEDQLRNAINGAWSLGCATTVYRIARLTRLVGRPLPWDRVPISLLLNGWYERIHEALGKPSPLTPEQRLEAERIRARQLSV